MKLSRLNKRIKFIVKEKGKDEDGFPIESNKPIRECFASIRGLRGREFYSAAAVQSENNKVFNCRYFKGLTTDMKIEYDEVLYDIISINNLYEKNIEYEIHAKEVKSSG